MPMRVLRWIAAHPFSLLRVRRLAATDAARVSARHHAGDRISARLFALKAVDGIATADGLSSFHATHTQRAWRRDCYHIDVNYRLPFSKGKGQVMRRLRNAIETVGDTRKKP
jgi:hypothetical protein